MRITKNAYGRIYCKNCEAYIKNLREHLETTHRWEKVERFKQTKING